MGPDGIPIKVWRYLGDIAIVWRTKMFKNIFRSNKMPEVWRRSILVPIYKNKGDIQSCTNYQGIKLMSHAMKLWESHRAASARNDADINKPIWFHARKVTTEAIFLIRQVMERFREQKKYLHLVFIDLEEFMTRYQEMLCGGLWTNIKSHQST